VWLSRGRTTVEDFPPFSLVLMQQAMSKSDSDVTYCEDLYRDG